MGIWFATPLSIGSIGASIIVIDMGHRIREPLDLRACGAWAKRGGTSRGLQEQDGTLVVCCPALLPPTPGRL